MVNTSVCKDWPGHSDIGAAENISLGSFLKMDSANAITKFFQQKTTGKGNEEQNALLKSVRQTGPHDANARKPES